jgi:NitT/TauT family transport system substrate-binding protein
VQRLKRTVVDGDSTFLASLDPAFAARDLVDDRFVRKSIDAVGGLTAFGQSGGFRREEIVVV